MNNHSSTPTPRFAEAAPGIVIIYEDLATGLQAKRFSDLLCEALECPGHCAPACWRSEMLDVPGVPAQVTTDAERGDFLILALRGDRSLSVALKHWLESWLTLAKPEGFSLIALFDRTRRVARQVESARCYLRQISSEAGIPFFSHCMVGAGAPDVNSLENKIEVSAQGAWASFVPVTVAA